MHRLIVIEMNLRHGLGKIEIVSKKSVFSRLNLKIRANLTIAFIITIPNTIKAAFSSSEGLHQDSERSK